MQVKAFTNAPKFSQLQQLAVVIQTGYKPEIVAAINALLSNPDFSGTAWRANFAKLAMVINSGLPAFKIFAMGGNSKLPFVAFSTLPGVTCPGAGACIDFCYSYRAWRYPAAFCRMAQNAFLMRHNPEVIAAAFKAIPLENFDFRLYVDGDFSSVDDVAFWFNLLNAKPSARAYGYSKSFAQILQYKGQWPTNYLLNISSGHNADTATVDKIKSLPITRGEFVAVSIGRKVKSADHGTVENNRAIRAAMGEVKAFPCPGQCGACTGAGHACGLPQLKGRVIAIAIH